VEVVVRLESGQSVAVIQPGSPNEFRVGDRVRVSSDGVTTRVSR
jgi:outer membrane lipoprotein SlyB